MTRQEMTTRAQAIGARLGAEVLVEERLAPHLSLRVGGTVAALVKPPAPGVVAELVRGLESERVPFRLLGGGSNVVAEDGPLDFIVVDLGAAGGSSRWEGSRVRVPAGMTLGAVLRDSSARGMSGLEWAAGLPGTMGGAVAGNAGAFGGDMGDSVREVLLLGSDGSLRTHVVAPGDFAYRRSFLQEGDVVLEVVLELEPSDSDAVRREVDRVNRTRAASQPKGGHSAGCMFKNPAEGPAGRIIDECGLKGLRRGGASVSTAHANFVVNDGSATAADILGLIDDVRREVRARRGIDLESEVRVWRAGYSEGDAS